MEFEKNDSDDEEPSSVEMNRMKGSKPKMTFREMIRSATSKLTTPRAGSTEGDLRKTNANPEVMFISDGISEPTAGSAATRQAIEVYLLVSLLSSLSSEFILSFAHCGFR